MANGNGTVKCRSELYEWQDEFLDCKKLSSTTKLVLLVIRSYMNVKNMVCFASQETIARRASLSERAVCEHTRIAQKAGWLGVYQNSGTKQAWRKNNYQPCIPDEVFFRSDKRDDSE